VIIFRKFAAPGLGCLKHHDRAKLLTDSSEFCGLKKNEKFFSEA